ncbi:DUF523 and DUF1722 domain-containing protein [Sulfurimonas sp. HSL1-2]|uniref:YbgA family protein n=1 Tax=Thiomicrolovo zhangzhouensis TaxID=3131933 RepID=UPI0031FA3041
MTIAVSACLLGEKVRFDGGHKHFRFLTESLAEYATFVPFCPEHLAFGTPRPSIRLVHDDTHAYVLSNKTGGDVTAALAESVQTELDRLRGAPLTGIIFKAKSPSCGFGSAKMHLPNGHSDGKHDGLFVQRCKEAFPLLPMEEEARLQDAWLRENFIMQLFAYDAFERMKAECRGMHDLVRFHTVNKFLLQAKDEALYRQMGRVVANAENRTPAEVMQTYEYLFKSAIAEKSSLRRTRNVLEHMAGFFKRLLTPAEKAMLHEQIDDYAAKLLTLMTPVSTIRFLAAKYGVDYLLKQTFLDPYPKSMALRSYLESSR